MSKRAIRVASLFSGAGGFDAGFHAAGFRTVIANDVRRRAVETFSRNFGLPIASVDAPSKNPAVYHGNVKYLDFKALAELAPEVLIGGPPCQDFSMARAMCRRRPGVETYRGQLYKDFVRALIVFQPDIFVFENVPGLISANEGRAFEVIIQDLRSIGGGSVGGYRIVFLEVVRTSDLGVPQARRRLFVLGVKKGWMRRGFSPDRSEVEMYAKYALSGWGSLLGRYPLTTIETFEGKPLPDLSREYRRVMAEWGYGERDIVRDYFAVNGIEPATHDEPDVAFMEHENVLRELGYLGRPVEGVRFPDGSNELPCEKDHVVERVKRIPPGEDHRSLVGTQWAVNIFSGPVYRRVHPLRPSYTIVAKGGGGTVLYHYDRNRSKMTNREQARLQSFPDDFLFSGGSGEVRSQIGEAFPPLVAKRIAEVCRVILDGGA